MIKQAKQLRSPKKTKPVFIPGISKMLESSDILHMKILHWKSNQSQSFIF